MRLRLLIQWELTNGKVVWRSHLFETRMSQAIVAMCQRAAWVARILWVEDDRVEWPEDDPPQIHPPEVGKNGR